MTGHPAVEQMKRRISELEEQVRRCRWSEEALQEKDQQLKAMVEAFDGLIYVCSQDYRVEYINKRYVERIGFDATGQICYQALHNRNSVCPWCLNERILKGETVRCEVMTHRSKWYHVVSTPIHHPNGSMSKHAMIIDITDRKQAEKSLKKKVDEQELLLDNILVQIWYLTDPETYGAVNRAHAEFLGMEKSDIEGKNLFDVLHSEEAGVFVAGNLAVFEHKQKKQAETWVANGSGEKRLLSIIKTPKLDSSGQVEYVVCSGEDITDYRRSEERLRESKKRLDLAMEATSDALWDWNLKTNQTYFNACFYTMLGYRPYEMEQRFRTWNALIHPEDRRAAVKKIRDYVENRIDIFELEYRLKTKQGGWRWIMARGKVAERDETGTPVRMVGTHVDITERKLNEEALRESEAHLREENVRLRSTLKSANQFGNIIGKSDVMHEVYEIILKSALSNANVIIYGDSGTGKELVAQTIHELSSRNGGRFVTVNCGAIPDNLVESEFFGYQKGAFTGADTDKPGYLDSAEGGTLFMDEVGELDLNMQVKLLRAIEGGGYTPIGSREPRKPDVRIIAATNRDLKTFVKNGRMREDFYYRIHIIPIHLPPLKDRKGDLPLLIHHFLQLYSDGTNFPSIPESVMKSMRQYDWPGNVRELQNTIHRYITLREIDYMGISEHASETATDHPVSPAGSFSPDLNLRVAREAFERDYIQQMLHAHRWHRSRVAEILGVNRKTLFKKMKQHGLSKSP